MQEPQPILTQVHGRVLRVLRVVPEKRLLDDALAPDARIANYSLPALMAIKESVNRSCEFSLTEGTHAFLPKRTPVFQHR